MTVEKRAREFAAAIQSAVQDVEPRTALPPRRQPAGRILIAIFLALWIPPAGAALVQLASDRETSTHQRVVEEDRKGIAGRPPGQSPRPLATYAPDSSERRAPSDRTAPVGVPPSSDARPVVCEPLISDPKGDIDDPSVDIIRSTITYDDQRHQLVFEHQVDDIPSIHPPGQTLVYDLDFVWDGSTYHVQATVDPAGQDMYFVERDHRTRSWPESESHDDVIEETEGSIDRRSDTVTVFVRLDEFNEGERNVARDEGMEPADELTVGSELTSVVLRAYPYAAGSAPYDTATGCDYKVGPRPKGAR